MNFFHGGIMPARIFARPLSRKVIIALLASDALISEVGRTTTLISRLRSVKSSKAQIACGRDKQYPNTRGNRRLGKVDVFPHGWVEAASSVSAGDILLASCNRTSHATRRWAMMQFKQRTTL